MSSHDCSTEELLDRYVPSRDPAVREALIERQEGLVRTVASKFARPGVPLEDLVQTARVALVKALDENAPLRQAIETLENRVQEIVRLRFFAGYSQRQVADVLGISQMQVSRLERRTLARLRTRLVEAV